MICLYVGYTIGDLPGMRAAVAHLLMDSLSDRLKFQYGTRFRDLWEAAANFNSY
jgi:hypothetical protein